MEHYTVWRRFSDFCKLFDILVDRYTPCIIPPLPDKSFQDKLVKDDSLFVEIRKKELEFFLIMIYSHQVLKSTKEFSHFLTSKEFIVETPSKIKNLIFKKIKSVKQKVSK
jgi:hypothetical protein